MPDLEWAVSDPPAETHTAGSWAIHATEHPHPAERSCLWSRKTAGSVCSLQTQKDPLRPCRTDPRSALLFAGASATPWPADRPWTACPPHHSDGPGRAPPWVMLNVCCSTSGASASVATGEESKYPLACLYTVMLSVLTNTCLPRKSCGARDKQPATPNNLCDVASEPLTTPPLTELNWHRAPHPYSDASVNTTIQYVT